LHPGERATSTLAVHAEKIKAALADQHLTLGAIVMMHAYLAADPAADPAAGHGDFKGWTAARTLETDT
jgi:hypothetical protein